jgi:hypothetical protein
MATARKAIYTEMFSFLKKITANSWLGRVYRADRVLFIVLSLFFTLTIVSNLIKLQTSPFFIWDMYSREIEPAKAYPYYQIRYNGTRVFNLRHTWNEPEKAAIFNPLDYYLLLRARGSEDPFRVYLESHWLKKHPAFTGLTAHLYLATADLDKYPAWFKHYLSLQAGEPVSEICVLKKAVTFEKSGSPREIASDTVLYIP